MYDGMMTIRGSRGAIQSEKTRPMGRETIMELAKDVIDEGADEINVCGIASVEPISVDQVRVTYFTQRKGERLAVVHLIWGMNAWMACWGMWDQARASIVSECTKVTRVGGAIARAVMH